MRCLAKPQEYPCVPDARNGQKEGTMDRTNKTSLVVGPLRASKKCAHPRVKQIRMMTLGGGWYYHVECLICGQFTAVKEKQS